MRPSVPALFITFAGVMSVVTVANAQSCLTQLSQIAQIDRPEPVQASEPACVIPEQVRLISTKETVPVAFSDKPILDCPFALKLTRFTTNRIQPLAEFHLGTKVTTIATGPGFVCRRRNNRPDGKLSEHAFGNAVDITTMKFANGEHFEVKQKALQQPPAAAFQASIRREACVFFTTVIGPGTNDAHATHLHLDLGRSKDNPNPYRICE